MTVTGLTTGTVLPYLLLAVVAVPFLGSVTALLPAPPGLRGRGPDQAVLRHGVTVTGAVLLLSVALAAGFDRGDPARMQATTDVPWIPALGTRFHLGVDGVSLPLLVLTALLTFLCAVHAYFRGPKGTSARGFVALLLLLEGGTLATFAVLDLLLFFLAFETVLIPMYFLIARWGGAGRERAAWKFILYTLLGSVVMLLGLLLLGLRGGTFDMVALATDSPSPIGHGTQLLAVLAIGAGLAVKTPMWPLHSWLPDAHTAAPTTGSVLLAGVLLKMGTYGFVRILLPIAPDGMRTVAPYLGALAVAGIVYGSLACLGLALPPSASPRSASPAGAGEGPGGGGGGGDGGRFGGGDLKRLIAYSSVGHMGFVLLGIASLTPTGVNGALFANIAHGLITGLLFFLVGAVKERYGTADLDRLAGVSGGALYGRAPRLGGLFAFGAVASLGLPGLAGFWGEMLALFGAFRPADGLNRPLFLVFTAVGAAGTLLTAAYLLVVVRRVCMGDREPGHSDGAVPAAPADVDASVDTDGSDGSPGASAASAEGMGAREGAQAGGRAGPHAAAHTAPAAGSGPAATAPVTATPAGTAPATATPAASASRGAAPPVFADVRGHEFAAWTPLVVLTVLAGLWPAVLLGLTDPAVQALLTGGSR
ncbi:complex I subunit 4 family protein [Streptomyces zingiberis]|uniref:NADH-quinone oxidoreductase subunit M n=1 Tax=Streptomyces zingiberis TaxID=2053010 RepID=A0ABX1C2Q5_9ACTN|nr:NADH-quinone oxidoreductase subunit M [Streptomyces zingiberis]NJQ02960.1 NADH-quinone oxidoreductase subunit M [Streptomyces zingiberis]